MNENIERVLAVLDGFRMSDEMTYSAYSVLYDEISMLDDLLKAQDPRVMTLEEVIAYNNENGCVWYEMCDIVPVFVFCKGYRKYAGIIEMLSPYFLQEPQYHCFRHSGDYGKLWRIWTSRPTDEQREKVKWEVRSNGTKKD